MSIRWLVGVLVLAQALGGCAKISRSGRYVAGRPDLPPDVQVCHVRHEGGAELQLHMELSERPHLMRECQRVADYLALPPAPLPPFAVPEAEAALRRLRYFKDVQCALSGSQAMVCRVTNMPMVRSQRIAGHVPITLLHEDIRRRISLRPGTLMPDMTLALHNQAARLETYLRGEGYFDAVVALTPHRVRGTGLHQDIHLNIDVSARETAKVRRIVVEGQPHLRLEKLTRPFWNRTFLGFRGRFKPLSLAEYVAEATTMLRDKGFVGAHVQASYVHHPEARAVDLTLRVAAGRRVEVHFVGNTHVSRRRLMWLAPFASSGAADAVAVEELRDSIVRLYQEKGFAEVDVQSTIGQAEGDTVHVTYVIDAGERYTLDQVVFKNLSHVRPLALLQEGKLLQQVSGRMLKRRWVDAYVAHDEALLTALLRAQGLARAQVVARKQPGSRPHSLVLTYDIDEGPKRRVRGVNIEGIPSDLSESLLRPRLQLQPGGPLVGGGLDGDVGEIESQLATRGYIAAHVEAELMSADGRVWHEEDAALRDTDKEAAATGALDFDVRYRVDPGAQAHLGGIFIHGNYRTRSSTLLQEIGLRVGAPLNLSALGAARRSLRGLNLFNAVQVTPAHSSLGAADTWLVLAVEERPVRSVEAVAGFSSDFRFSVGADAKDANVLGRAILLSLQVRLSNAANLGYRPLRIGDQDLIEAKLRAPRPYGLPVTAEASALYRYRDVRAYQERRLTGQASLSRPLLRQSACAYCPDVMGQIGYDLTESYLFDKLGGQNTRVVSAPETTTARIVPKVTLSRRDSAIDPRRGGALDVAFELAHPAIAGNLGQSASAFYRVLLGVQAFAPLGVPVRVPLSQGRQLGGPLVLAVATSLSTATPYGARGGVPASETFGYGGDLSVRGLRARASTLQLSEAHAMVTASAELRWYVMENWGIGSVQLAFFVDSGSVARAVSELYREHTLSLGPAVRYVTPIGPLSLAYGYATTVPDALRNSAEAPRHGRLHLTFGYTF